MCFLYLLPINLHCLLLIRILCYIFSDVLHSRLVFWIGELALVASFTTGISQQLFFADPRLHVANSSTVALVSEKCPHTGDVVTVSPQTSEILRVLHQVPEISVTAHGHHEPLQPHLRVDGGHVHIQPVTYVTQSS